MENTFYDVIILGAGPAGLFCASRISNDYSVLIIDKSLTPAQKLLLSAKGRGNITNIKIKPEFDYVTSDQAFVINAFEKYGVKDFIEFVENQGINLKEEDNGRILLKSGKVSEFYDKLLQIVKNNGVEIRLGSEFLSVNKADNLFEIKTSSGIYKSKNFVVATGGPSFPKLGSTSIAIDIAKIFNLEYLDFYPALVGFGTNTDFSSLSGSSVIGDLTLLKGDKIIYKERGPVLFTHQGISGPSVFNASLFMRELNGKYKFKLSISSENITKRLLYFLGFHRNVLKEYKITSDIVCIPGLNEAKVCGGGIDTNNLNNNFECKNISGLYFIGECTDVTGKTGGFNLQWCWTSAAICSEAINNKK